ncbi:MAG: zinc ribbon domain-containing protein [Thermodesulfovibrionales bacterium]|jgi:putative transposase
MLRENRTVTVNPAYTTQDCSRCGYRVPKTLSEKVLHTCPQCGLLLCRHTNAARIVEQEAFGEVSANAESSTDTAGPEQSELVPEVRGNKRLWRQGPLPHQPHAVSSVAEANILGGFSYIHRKRLDFDYFGECGFLNFFD